MVLVERRGQLLPRRRVASSRPGSGRAARSCAPARRWSASGLRLQARTPRRARGTNRRSSRCGRRRSPAPGGCRAPPSSTATGTACAWPGRRSPRTGPARRRWVGCGCHALTSVPRRGRRTGRASPRAACRPSARCRASVNRANSAVLSTGTGTPSSIAALSVQRPSPLSLTRPSKPDSCGVGEQRVGGEVEQPAGDDAAAPPHLGDRRQIEVVLVVLRMGQRRGLGVLGALLGADVRAGEDVQPSA